MEGAWEGAGEAALRLPKRALRLLSSGASLEDFLPKKPMVVCLQGDVAIGRGFLELSSGAVRDKVVN